MSDLILGLITLLELLYLGVLIISNAFIQTEGAEAEMQTVGFVVLVGGIIYVAIARQKTQVNLSTFRKAILTLQWVLLGGAIALMAIKTPWILVSNYLSLSKSTLIYGINPALKIGVHFSVLLSGMTIASERKSEFNLKRLLIDSSATLIYLAILGIAVLATPEYRG